jgi:hypothetical protein
VLVYLDLSKTTPSVVYIDPRKREGVIIEWLAEKEN